MIYSCLTQQPIELDSLKIPNDITYIQLVISIFNREGDLLDCISEYLPNSISVIRSKVKVVYKMIEKLELD
jgi:hypothetical protein